MSRLIATLWLSFAILISRTEVSAGINCGDQDGPLGMISGEIRDWQITASSSFPEKYLRSGSCQCKHARLYGPDGLAWCAQLNSGSEWLQVDLGVEAIITGLMTQGRGDGNDWVSNYSVSYSSDATDWLTVTDEAGQRKIFEANLDAYSVKHNYFKQPFSARFIRVHPLQSNRHPSLRMELLGCQPCKQSLAQPPYARLTASSSRGRRAMRTCDASYGHAVTGKAWCAKRLNEQQWLQVDLGPPALVTGLMTKGRGDGRADAWVTAYRVAYSNDGRSWALYKDADHLSPKLFNGNHNRDSERVHYLNRPFTARYIRFHPVRWQGSIAMRVDVIGCHQEDSCVGGGGGGAFFRVSNSSRCLANLAYNKPAWLGISDDTDAGGSRHRKRQAGANGGADSWDSWSESVLSGAGGGCVSVSSTASVVGWLVDLKTKQPVQGVLLMANGTLTGPQRRLEVYVAKKSRQVVGTGRPNRRGLAARKILCGFGKADALATNQLNQQYNVHIACAKPMHGRFVYIEVTGGDQPGVPAASYSMSDGVTGGSALCNLRVY